HTHDTFKGEAAQGVPIIHSQSHASLARDFLSSFCSDNDLLAMVQYHDEPFALWVQFQRKGRYSEDRFTSLLQAITNWHVFLAFTVIDGCTDGKSREPLRWFLKEIAGKVESTITAADIL
ncbi:MAG: hypothetical protein ACE5MM_02980, partial [Nitrospiraceae bacterium]